MSDTAPVRAADVRPGDHVWSRGTLRLITGAVTVSGVTTLHHGGGMLIMSADAILHRIVR